MEMAALSPSRRVLRTSGRPLRIIIPASSSRASREPIASEIQLERGGHGAQCLLGCSWSRDKVPRMERNRNRGHRGLRKCYRADLHTPSPDRDQEAQGCTPERMAGKGPVRRREPCFKLKSGNKVESMTGPARDRRQCGASGHTRRSQPVRSLFWMDPVFLPQTSACASPQSGSLLSGAHARVRPHSRARLALNATSPYPAYLATTSPASRPSSRSFSSTYTDIAAPSPDES